MAHKPRKTIISDGSTWGKLNAGQVWHVLAADVDRALACAGLNKAEAKLMGRVREESWGSSTRAKAPGDPWPEARPVALNLTHIAREMDPTRWEKVRKQLGQARAALLRDGLLAEAEDGRVTINKEVHQWRRLTTADLAYCRAAQTRRAHQPPPNGGASRPRMGAAPAPEWGRKSPPNGGGALIEERARDLEIREDTHRCVSSREDEERARREWDELVNGEAG